MTVDDEDASRSGRAQDAWRAVFEASPVPAAIARQVDGQILFVNPACLQLLGWIEAELVGRTMLEAGFWRTAEQRARMLERLSSGKGVHDLEQTITTRSGDAIVALTSIAPVELDGEACLVGHVHDITQRRRLADELREREDRFRLLAESSTDVIARSSPDWTIQYMSPATRALYGYEPEEMVGRSGWEFVHPEDRARLSRELSAGVGAAGDVTNSYRVRRKDGSYVWVEAKTVALSDPLGDVVEFHTSARDISERREADAVVRMAKEEAERANLAKSEFLSRMSHELRTPLHAILGFGELLARENRSSTQGEALEQITKGGRHLLELINEVLDISASERGELRLSLEPVHAGLVIRDALDMMAPLAAARSISLNPPDDDALDCHVRADRHRLKQVLLNLLSNAVKYNRDGGEVRVSASARDSERVRLAVCDSGIGISPANLERVFTAFERLGAETTVVEGTGLGLTLTKRLIEAMHGTIGVQSEVGTGTTFWIELPVVDAPRAARRSAERSAPAAGRPRRPPQTVLYIEDNPSNVKLVEAILARRPEVTLLVATQGGLGLELAREHRPTVVLLDLNLPDMSGEQVLQRMRGDERTADLTVVILSADATPGQIARLRRAGADDYLAKPFDIEQFLAVIDGGTPAVAATEPGDGADAGPLRPDRVTKLRRLYPEDGALREFVDLFLADMTARIDGLQSAARARDAPAVWQAAHAMRGSSSIAGAHRVQALLAQFEADARRGDVPDAPSIGALRAAFDDAYRRS